MFLKFESSFRAEMRQARSEMALISSRTFAEAHAVSCLTFLTSAGLSGVNDSLVFTLGAHIVSALFSCRKWHPPVGTTEYKILTAGQTSTLLQVKLPWNL